MSFSSEVREELLKLNMWDNNSNLKQDEQLARLLIRESFIKKGFIGNPKREYHFEILFKSKKELDKIKDIVSNYGIDIKSIKKGSQYMLYLKDGEEISLLLSLMGVQETLIKFDKTRKIKETRNNINRIVNCETANLSRTIQAAVKQIKDIEKLKGNEKFEKLPNALKELANLRLKNPDSTYEELRQDAFKTNRKVWSKS